MEQGDRSVNEKHFDLVDHNFGYGVSSFGLFASNRLYFSFCKTRLRFFLVKPAANMTLNAFPLIFFIFIFESSCLSLFHIFLPFLLLSFFFELKI